ncbi:MAG: glycosyltransferase [Actinobacteria bacterium]|nr:glycosyltransferase [Actinomycetota bacterium]
MKLAIVHDFLNQYGGAERVVGHFLKIFPDSPLYTSIFFPDDTFDLFRDKNIITTFMQKIPGIRKHFKEFFFLYPFAFKSLKIRGFEIILGSSSSYSHFIKKPPGAVHINYCYTPPRFLWETEKYLEGEKIPGALFTLARPALFFLRKMDLGQSRNIDYYIAISKYVRDKIKKVYNRESVVIYPPVDFERYRFSRTKEDFYLVVSRLKGYKRVDIAVEAFNILGKKLVIVGTGEDGENLKKISGKNVEFLGAVSDRKLLDLYSRARALIFTGKEDLGLTPLEAQASGTPVIAYGEGGALETIVDGKTGVFFYNNDSRALIEAVTRFEENPLDPLRCRENAAGFGFDNFKKEIEAFIKNIYRERFAS